MIDLYQILEVPLSASREDIQRAYERLSREWNPEHNDHPTASLRIADINEAWYWLGDHERRLEYDRDYFRFRSELAEAARQVREEERRERERHEQERQREQARQEAEDRRQREEAEQLVQQENKAEERRVREELERHEPENGQSEILRPTQPEEQIKQDERNQSLQGTRKNPSDSGVSNGTHNFVCLVIGAIIAIGLVLFVRLVWVSEQDPISRPSWDAEKRNERVAELQATARKSQTEIPRLRATISTLPSEQEMLERIAAIGSVITPLPANNRTDADLNRVADQVASSILANVYATSVASWRNRGTRVAGTATAVAKGLKLYEASVDHFERESATRRDFWIFVALVVGVVILLFAVAVARNRRKGHDNKATS